MKMNKITIPFTNKMSPSATNMIRMDHTHVIELFHQYKFDDSPEDKQSNVSKNCLAIEIHAQLEEEFFYPALRRVMGDNAVLRKAVPEHDELRHLIGKLRGMDPSEASYDATYMQLLRNVLHHVADEESVLLTEAEHLLADQLHEIGAQMTRRRMQLMARHAGHYMTERVRAHPARTVLIAAGAVMAGTMLARHSFARPIRERIAQAGNRIAEGRSRIAERGGAMEGNIQSGRVGFKLGRMIGKGEGMGRGLLWGRRSPI